MFACLQFMIKNIRYNIRKIISEISFNRSASGALVQLIKTNDVVSHFVKISNVNT